MAGKRVSSLGKRGVDGEKKELSLFSLTPPFKPECLYEALRLDDVVVLHFTEYMYLLQITSRAHSVIYGIMLKTPLLASFCNANKCGMYEVRHDKFGKVWSEM